METIGEFEKVKKMIKEQLLCADKKEQYIKDSIIGSRMANWDCNRIGTEVEMLVDVRKVREELLEIERDRLKLFSKWELNGSDKGIIGKLKIIKMMIVKKRERLDQAIQRVDELVPYSNVRNSTGKLHYKTVYFSKVHVNAKVWLDKGDTYGRKQKYNKALIAYNKALEIKPYYLEALHMKGITFINLDRYNDALSSFDNSIELISNYNYRTWYYKGLALFCLDRYEEALDAYNKALELSSDDAGLWFEKGKTLHKLNRHEKALNAYDKVLELKPDYKVWHYKVYSLFNLKRFNEALNACDKILDQNPNDAKVLDIKKGLIKLIKQ